MKYLSVWGSFLVSSITIGQSPAVLPHGLYYKIIQYGEANKIFFLISMKQIKS